ncbi:MAG TPA: ArsB/NhaD family transporter, partial [Methanocorpusculum sp.]|nr:ArsB/NhaD family transporter [Methanocorpusculum sp.]
MAEKTATFAGNSQIKLFFAFYLIISLLTVFTSNDIIILTFTPFICYFAKYAGINPIPYLILEFVAANTWSMMLIIGNPTNIYLASSFGITFMDYLSVMVLPAVTGSLIALLLLWLLFHKQISFPLHPMQTTVSLRNKTGVAIGLIHLIVCVVLLALSSYIGIEMWLVSLVCACSLAICSLILSFIQQNISAELSMAVRRVPWQFIPFILAMFTIVLALASAQVTDTIAEFLSCANSVWAYGI